MKEVKIKDIAKVISGYAFKSGDFKDKSDIPVIKITNVRHEVVEFGENTQYVEKSCSFFLILLLTNKGYEN